MSQAGLKRLNYSDSASDCENRRFSSLYYFVSRVVHTHASGLARQYDSPINKLALAMSAKGLDDYSQGVLWIWRK